jgi:hypothetical protein
VATQLEETIERLRDLHGVYERALMLAGDELAASHPTPLSSSQWQEILLRRAEGELEQVGVYHGRWSLFSSREIGALASALRGDRSGPAAVGLVREALAGELRGLVREDEAVTRLLEAETRVLSR